MNPQNKWDKIEKIPRELKSVQQYTSEAYFVSSLIHANFYKFKLSKHTRWF